MMTSFAYLDHNATSTPRPEAIAAATAALALTGNASSIHSAGRTLRRVMEEARSRVAALAGADKAGVVFTASGSEANALAAVGFRRKRLLVGAVEHASLRSLPGAEIVPVDADGIIDLAALDEMLAANAEPALVCLMLANNETGAIQPVARAAQIAHLHGALLHCDAVQAAGKVELDMAALGADSLALAAHKIGGPAGVGALVLAKPDQLFVPMVRGGGQESGRRAGTENISGIAGFGAAAMVVRDRLAGDVAHALTLRNRIEAEVKKMLPEARVMAEAVARLPNTACIAVPGMSARNAVIALDLANVAISAGAACAAGRVEDSPVLKAMGEDMLAGSAIRVSVGWNSTPAEVDQFLAAFGAFALRTAPSSSNWAA